MYKTRQEAVNILTNIFESVKGPKIAILDQSFIKVLNIITDESFLKKYVEQTLLITNDKISITPNIYTIMYFTRPKPYNVKTICEQIKKSFGKEYHIYFIPEITYICEYILENYCIKNIKISNLNLDLIPLYDDVLSFELNDIFKEFYLDYDITCVKQIVNSIHNLEQINGTIKNIKGKGLIAERVINMFCKNRNNVDNKDNKKISTLILIDRTTDLITPMLTPYTFEGLAHEIFGISSNSLDIAEIGKIKLEDPDFNKFQNISFDKVGSILNAQVKEVKQIYDSRPNNNNLNELSQYVKNLKICENRKKILENYTTIAEKINKIVANPTNVKRMRLERETIFNKKDDKLLNLVKIMIDEKKTIYDVLKLLCLYSMIYNITDKEMDYFYGTLIEVYGYNKMFLLDNLKKVGLLSQSPQYKNIKQLHLQDDSNEETELESFFIGYIPITVRMVENWVKYDEKIPVENLTIIYFLGGVTYAEISAIRFLGKKLNKIFLICTTSIINGAELIQSLDID
jgi:hypothetical protein